MRIISNGRIIDPKNERDEVGDLFIKDGKIVGSISAEEAKSARLTNASKRVVCPGLVDIHVHFREPGQTHKETIETGSWAAAAGGFTSVVCMPNTNPPADDAGTIQYIVDAAQRGAVVNVYPTGCITVDRKGERLAPIGSLKRAGVVAISDDGDCVQNNEIMRRALEYASMFGLPIMDHCQDMNLTKGGVMNEGEMSLRLGLMGWPSTAEDIIVARNTLLAELTGAHIHMQHISSAGAVEVLRRAKQRGVEVTAEVTPHHLALTDACIQDYNTNFKMNPPLRTEEDRQALIKGIKDGTLDILATDHAPHTNYEKDREFDYAPFGVVGLETCFAVCREVLCEEAGMSLPEMIGLMTYKPAELLDLPAGTLSEGAQADVIILDPWAKWTVEEETLLGKSKNSPWLGEELTGRIDETIVAGRTVYQNGKVIG
ncbi:MAG: amidohydrolase family protein [Opitutae bacterium]|nr:amidohydrolase family protein [Opitutae bacterium]